MVGRVREEPPAACDLAELEASVGVGVLGGELGECRGDLAGGHPEHLREVRRGDRVVRDEKHRLEHALERVRVEMFELFHQSS